MSIESGQTPTNCSLLKFARWRIWSMKWSIKKGKSAISSICMGTVESWELSSIRPGKGREASCCLISWVSTTRHLIGISAPSEFALRRKTLREPTSIECSRVANASQWSLPFMDIEIHRDKLSIIILVSSRSSVVTCWSVLCSFKVRVIDPSLNNSLFGPTHRTVCRSSKQSFLEITKMLAVTKIPQPIISKKYKEKSQKSNRTISISLECLTHHQQFAHFRKSFRNPKNHLKVQMCSVRVGWESVWHLIALNHRCHRRANHPLY